MIQEAPVIIREGQNYSVTNNCWNTWLAIWGKISR